MKGSIPPPPYDPHAPFRLDIAARIAFPDGTMGTSGLRKERDAGRLVTELIAGKEYTTLAAIEDMRAACRGRRMTHRRLTEVSRPDPAVALVAAKAVVAALRSKRSFFKEADELFEQHLQEKYLRKRVTSSPKKEI